MPSSTISYLKNDAGHELLTNQSWHSLVGNDQNKEVLPVTRILVDGVAVPPVCAFGMKDIISPCKEDMDNLAQEMSSA